VLRVFGAWTPSSSCSMYAALDGDLVTENDVVHVYEIRDGLITRMDVEESS